MYGTLVEMSNPMNKAVYVYTSSKYPGLLKIGSAKHLRTRVRQQVETDEFLTVIRAYKDCSLTHEVLERKLQTEFVLLNHPLPGRTECFDLSVGALDKKARQWGLHIHPLFLEVGRE
jgi:hypothetical protein